jgi:GDP-6-deoxy-D-talose 4-dehydrogenase
MPKTVVITGVSGFTGRYVRAALERRGYAVLGIANTKPQSSQDVAIDLADYAAVQDYFASTDVDCVVHLAGASFVAHDNPTDFYRSNVLGSAHLLEAIARSRQPIEKVVLASSANVYGRPVELPVTEGAATAPLSHYAVSKVAMELMAKLWFERLPILVVRPFNYTGVGQSPRFVLAKLAQHFRERRPELELGDTAVIREFMDVRDVAEIYAGLVENNVHSDVVNLCSGLGHQLSDVIKLLSQTSGHNPVLKRAEAMLRGNEIPALVGSPAKLRSVLGTLEFRPFEETLAWMMQA